MTIEQINPLAIKAKAQKLGGAKAISGEGFSSMLDMVSAGVAPMAATSAAMYGNNTAAAALNAAFSGMSQTAGAMGGGMSYGASFGGVGSSAPYLAAGVGYKGTTVSGGIGSLDSTAAIPGSDGMSQMDMVNTMNQNNLQLLELQAVMQNNMQGWNTKSNILSADHRARMSMIEKFTARG